MLNFRDERDARRGDIEHLATSLVGKVNECVSAIDEGEWASRGQAVMWGCPPHACKALATL